MVPASMIDPYILALAINFLGFFHNIELILSDKRSLIVGLIFGTIMSFGTAEFIRYWLITLCGGTYVP